MIINNHKNFCDRLSIDYQYQLINIVIDCYRLSISSIVQVLITSYQFPKTSLVMWHCPNQRWQREMCFALHWFCVSFHLCSLLNWFCFSVSLIECFTYRARYDSDDLLSTSEWPLQMSLTLFSLTRSLLTPGCFSRVPCCRTTTNKQSFSV